jgi:hypothetical protein
MAQMFSPNRGRCQGKSSLSKAWKAPVNAHDGAYPAQGLDAWGRGLQETHKIDLEATPHQEGKASKSFPGGGQLSVHAPGF